MGESDDEMLMLRALNRIEEGIRSGKVLVEIALNLTLKTEPEDGE